MATAAEPQLRVYDRLYIGGQWVEPEESGRIEVLNAATEAVIGSVPEGTEGDIDRAVRAARAAFDGWSVTSPAERAEWMAKIAEALHARGEEIAQLISSEVGTPIEFSRRAQVGLVLNDFAAMPQAIADLQWQEEVGNSLVTLEPIGVVGAITPWNYPLHQIATKAAAAMAAGCTIVVKPSEIAPLNAFVLAEVLDELGLPAGVFNLVTGVGPVVGEALALHPDVDMVSFTGSTRAGRRVSELAARSVKPVALELGGKSPAIILDDADLETAVPAALGACYTNTGQTCGALTRMIVPRERLTDVEAIAAAAAAAQVTGDPLSESTTVGPLISDVQRDRVRGYIKKGVDEGAKLVCGGVEPPEGLERGYFVAPTVFSEVTPDMTIAREEIFGPVVSIIPYDDEEEAVQIANDTDYGLAGGVWSSDVERAKRVAQRLRTGQVAVNGGAFNPNAPFGGFKQSGHGRENGRFGIEEFLATRSINL